MKNKNPKRKTASAQKGSKGKGFSIDEDSFFDNEPKHRRNLDEDDDISSNEDEESDDGGEKREEEEREEEEVETGAEKRKRLAEAYLDNIREMVKRQKEGEESDEDDEGEREGERDTLVGQILMQEQLEESGRVRRVIASRVQKPEITNGFRVLVKHRQAVTAVALSDDDHRGFSASKDGSIVHWDVESGKVEKYLWPSNDVLKLHGAKDPQGRATKHSRSVLALATSSDGRYLASGGVDRHVHLWDTRTREHIQAFPGHRGLVSCLAFRQGSSELFSGSFDRTVKIWNVEDRAYINTLFGHQSEVLTIDCLRKERALTVGRDRSMHLFKGSTTVQTSITTYGSWIRPLETTSLETRERLSTSDPPRPRNVPEESRLVFRAPASSLECCCFINNDEFLSGSDDGSIEHWTVLRKKPIHIVKNAHTLVSPNMAEEAHDGLPNGLNGIENGKQKSENISSSADSWVSSVSVCRNSDLAASGAGNGTVRLWAIETDSKGIQPLFELHLVGFVNSLAFAKSGQFLVAGVGQEPRLGRWGRIAAARNGVSVHPLKLS